MGLSAQARQEAIKKAINALDESGSVKEAIRLPYKGGSEGPFDIIKVPVDAVLFNPRYLKRQYTPDRAVGRTQGR